MNLDIGSFHFNGSLVEVVAAVLLLFAPSPIQAIIKKQRSNEGEEKYMNKDFGEWADFIAEVARDYKLAKESNGIGFEDTLLIAPILLKLPTAIAGSSVAFQDLQAEEVKAAALKILEAAGDVDPKHALYVDRAFSILAHSVGIYEDVKAIQAA